MNHAQVQAAEAEFNQLNRRVQELEKTETKCVTDDDSDNMKKMQETEQ